MTMKKIDSSTLRAHKGVSFVGVATAAVCHDGEGNILLMKRGSKARDENGRWDVLGGGLKHGVMLEENLLRELKEELCTTGADIVPIGVREAHRQLDDGTKTHWIAIDYVMKIDRQKVEIGEPGVIDEIGWFTLDNLPSPLHSQLPKLFKTKSAEINQLINK